MATMTVSTPTTAKSPRIRPSLWIMLASLIVLAAIGWRWHLRLKSAAESKSNQVQWITPESRNIATDVNATGTVKLKTGTRHLLRTTSSYKIARA